MSNTIIILTGLSPDEIVEVIRKLDDKPTPWFNKTGMFVAKDDECETGEALTKAIDDTLAEDAYMACIHGVPMETACLACARLAGEQDEEGT